VDFDEVSEGALKRLGLASITSGMDDLEEQPRRDSVIRQPFKHTICALSSDSASGEFMPASEVLSEMMSQPSEPLPLWRRSAAGISAVSGWLLPPGSLFLAGVSGAIRYPNDTLMR